MKQEESRQLAGGWGNGGAELERSHSSSAVPQTAALIPGFWGDDAETSAILSAHRLLYDVHSAARLLSISRAQIYREMQRGALASVLIAGRCRRISRAALEAYVARLEEDSTP